MAANKKTKRDLSDIPQTLLVEIFNIPKATLQELKKGDMPHRRKGRAVKYNLFDFGPWLWRRARGRGALDKYGGGSKASPALERKREVEVELNKIKLGLANGEILLRPDVEKRETQIALAFKQSCEMAGRTLAPRLDGLDNRQRQVLIDKYFTDKLRELSGADDKTARKRKCKPAKS